MQEVIRMYRAYIVKLSMDKGIIDDELYERLIRKLMLTVVNLRLTMKICNLSEDNTLRTFRMDND